MRKLFLLWALAHFHPIMRFIKLPLKKLVIGFNHVLWVLFFNELEEILKW